jgi:hypothetical protein
MTTAVKGANLPYLTALVLTHEGQHPNQQVIRAKAGARAKAGMQARALTTTGKGPTHRALAPIVPTGTN